MVNGFLASVSSFSVNSFQSLGRVVAKKDQSVTELNAADRDKYPPVYAALADALDGETQERYRAANQFTRSLNMEKMWKNAVSAAAEGRADTSQEALKRNLTYRVIGDFLREEIVRHGKAAEIPNSEALLNLSRIGGPDFNRVEETVEQEMAAGNPKISMEYLKNNSLDQAERNKIRFFAKINKTEETAEKEETPRARRMTISLAELERTEGKRSSREVQAEREKRGNQPVRAAQPEKPRGMQK